MRASGYLVVMIIFVVVALLAYAIIRVVDWDANDLALVVAAIVASQVGALIWHRQSPASSERSVKLGLGAVLLVSAGAFALIFQAITGWLTYPEITIPIAAIGCFVFPSAVVGPIWKALGKNKPPERKYVEPDDTHD